MGIPDLFVRVGICGVILAALAWIAYSRLPSIQDDPSRWVEALSQPWLMKTAVLLAVLAWAWSFGRMFLGAEYLRGAGSFAELSTAILVLVLILSTVAWLAVRAGSPLRPWFTYGLVLALIASTGPLLLDAPHKVLSQENPDEDQRAVAFVQGRLAHLHCFDAADEREPTIETFGPSTHMAVVSFQQANSLIDPELDTLGKVRPLVEFKRLAKPFPIVFGPKPCRPGPAGVSQ